MKKKAIELAIELLIDKYQTMLLDDFKNKDSEISAELVEAQIEPILDFDALKTALNKNKYDKIWHAVSDVTRANKPYKKKLKQLRHILDQE